MDFRIDLERWVRVSIYETKQDAVAARPSESVQRKIVRKVDATHAYIYNCLERMSLVLQGAVDLCPSSAAFFGAPAVFDWAFSAAEKS